ncbi:MAG: phosphoribosylformylglycinamidine synthase subunit PurQ [Myxococcota bacterium]
MPKLIARGVRTAVIQFPGSNADWDALHVARDVLGGDAYYAFHKATEINGGGAIPDLVVIPGGFSYGDYLRPGAIARFSPVVPALVDYAKKGGLVLGICNGFQVLTELALLPGALTRNAHLRFECRDVFVRAEGRGAFTEGVDEGTVLRLPVAHADGRYQCDDETLRRLDGEGRVAFRYCDGEGQLSTPSHPDAPSDALANPNGSVANIAGIYDATGRILGLMPHPERASEPELGGRSGTHDGKHLFNAALRTLEQTP